MRSVTRYKYIIFSFMRIFKVNPLSNFHVFNIILLSMVSMLFLTSHDLFIAESLYLFTFRHFTPNTSCLWHPPVCSIYELGFFFFFFKDSTCKGDHAVFVFL